MLAKTYALFDVIGVKDAMKQGTVSTVLEKFWKTADAWANGKSHASMALRDTPGSTQVPRPHVVTFSDSALLFTDEEYELGAFYQIAGGLKKALENAQVSVYCIVSSGNEFAHHPHPALGVVGGDVGRPHYFNIAGSGGAWANLHYADAMIGKQKHWHGKYSLYAVGQASIPGNMTVQAEVTFRGLEGDQTVYALA